MPHSQLKVLESFFLGLFSFSIYCLGRFFFRGFGNAVEV